MPDPGPDPRHDAFIARQRAALKELGLPEAMLAREEACCAAAWRRAGSSPPCWTARNRARGPAKREQLV